MESDRLMSILESLLFAADGPVTADRLRNAVGVEVERKEVAGALKELQQEYEAQRRGVRLMEVANGFQLRTPSEHAEYVKNLVPVKTARMSRANLETLAIVAYKQPITKAEIEDIRGVTVDGVVSTLLERRLIRIVARKDVPGKPFLYGTTKDFLETFNLKDLSGLPTLKEMQEMTEALADAVPGKEAAAADGPSNGEGADGGDGVAGGESLSEEASAADVAPDRGSEPEPVQEEGETAEAEPVVNSIVEETPESGAASEEKGRE